MFDHFNGGFKEPTQGRPRMEGISFDKSLSPDGFIMAFYKASWDIIIKSDLFDCVNDFLFACHNSKEFSTSFLALIPKRSNRLVLDDFWTICLVGSVYHIISKLPAGSLKNVIGNLISDSQSAFILNRYMVDGVLVVNELI